MRQYELLLALFDFEDVAGTDEGTTAAADDA
jgi:hypothetical protein